MVAEAPLTCGTCDSLKRTSMEQRFLLCRFWSAESPPVPHVFSRFGHDYVITHCHMQPEAPACPFYSNDITHTYGSGWPHPKEDQ